jgi:hypothetical protein
LLNLTRTPQRKSLAQVSHSDDGQLETWKTLSVGRTLTNLLKPQPQQRKLLLASQQKVSTSLVTPFSRLTLAVDILLNMMSKVEQRSSKNSGRSTPTVVKLLSGLSPHTGLRVSSEKLDCRRNSSLLFFLFLLSLFCFFSTDFY